MTNKFHRYGKLLPALAAAAVVLILGACTAAAPAPLPDSKSNMSLLQQTDSANARLYGLMTFQSSGEKETTSLTVFAIEPVPIYWMGKIFDGKVEETDPEIEIIDQMHGSVSEDGDWLDTVFFSRQLTRLATNDGTFFLVQLRNVPVSKPQNSAANGVSRVFKKTGSDVQKYIDKIEYSFGVFSNKKILPIRTYTSTDWKNAWQIPSLELTLERGGKPREKRAGSPSESNAGNATENDAGNSGRPAGNPMMGR